jgi:hypothetical protein
MAESLTELTAVDYLNQKNLTGKLFGDSPNLAAEKITEGNVKVFLGSATGTIPQHQKACPWWAKNK